VKVTTEKLPKSLLALDIELDREQVEKGLERAARRLSQKYAIPGFRKGKAPRFIVENYFGRSALVEEATDDVLNKAFQAALEQEKVEPIGKAELDTFNLDNEPFTFRVKVPVAPTVQVPDYRAIKQPLEIEPVTDEMVDQAMKTRLDKHAVLRELDEPRAAQPGDELNVELEAFVDGEPLEPREPGTPVEPSTLVLEPDRLAEGLYDALVGAEVGQTLQVISHMPADHENERIRDKDVSFVVKVLGIKERLLPDWDELPTLEEFEGSLDELRAKTRAELVESAGAVAERKVIDEYVKQLIASSEFDIPDILIEREADSLLRQQESQYTRYGIRPEQLYEMSGQKRDDLVQNLMPQAEERLKTTLALQEIVRGEALTVSDDEVAQEVERMLEEYDEEQRDSIRATLSGQLRPMMAETALDKKLRRHVLFLAAGVEPEAASPASEAAAETAEAEPEASAPEAAQDAPVAEMAEAEPEASAPEAAQDAPVAENVTTTAESES
jgi:trigger factor